MRPRTWKTQTALALISIFAWLGAGCLESNPQPSPVVGQDTTEMPDMTPEEDGGAWPDTSPPSEDVGADIVCVPDCIGKECGPDGCGGACGDCPVGACYEGICSSCYLIVCDGQQCAPGEFCVDGECGCPDDCEGYPCGGDFCGGCCDPCGLDLACSEGTCLPIICEPDCTDKECGDDGCGGSCGPCGQCLDFLCADLVCTEDCDAPGCEIDCCDGSCFVCAEGGTCVDGACCMPDCTGKVCGSDGCGGSCGTCPDWTGCVQGQCVVEEPCGVQFEGQIGCDGCACQACVCETDPYCCDHPWDAICVYHCILGCGGCGACTPDCLGKDCGPDGCGGSCGACPTDAPFCVDGGCEAACIPDCAGRTCGPDGCGGSCGTCPDLEIQPSFATMIQACGADGQCHCARCDYHFDDLWSCEADCEIMFCMPWCDGKECGDDGCGGSCGQCPWSTECDGMGHCVCALP